MFDLNYAMVAIFAAVLLVYLSVVIPLGFRGFQASRPLNKTGYFGWGFSLLILLLCVAAHAYWSFIEMQSLGQLKYYDYIMLGFLNLILIPFFFHQIYFFGSMSSAVFFGKLNFLKREFELLKEEDLPSVTVIVPCRNEPFDVLKLTFDSVLSLRYPDQKISFIVCDNSDLNHKDYLKTKQYVESFSLTRNTQFIHRDGTEGFKAGNLDLAMKYTKSDLVLFVDVDSTVGANTLMESVADFAKESKLGFLQFLNVPTNSNAGLMAGVSSWLLAYWKYREFFRGGFGGWSFFQGHNAVWRTELLRQISPLAEKLWGEDMLVEDAFMTIKANKLGYFGKNKMIPCGFWVPGSLKEMESMFVRWSYGSFQIIFLELKFLFKNGKSQLTISEYLDMIYHFLSFSIQSFSPIFILVLAISHPAKALLAGTYIVSTYFFVFFVFLLKKDFRKMTDAGIGSFFISVLVLTPFLTWCSLKGTFQFIVRRRQKWIPTSKSNQKNSFELTWLNVIKQNFSAISIALLCLVIVLKEIIAHGDILSYITMAPIFLFSIGVILSIAIFGKTKMEYPDNLNQSATINKILGEDEDKNVDFSRGLIAELAVSEGLVSEQVAENQMPLATKTELKQSKNEVEAVD